MANKNYDPSRKDEFFNIILGLRVPLVHKDSNKRYWQWPPNRVVAAALNTVLGDNERPFSTGRTTAAWLRFLREEYTSLPRDEELEAAPAAAARLKVAIAAAKVANKAQKTAIAAAKVPVAKKGKKTANTATTTAAASASATAASDDDNDEHPPQQNDGKPTQTRRRRSHRRNRGGIAVAAAKHTLDDDDLNDSTALPPRNKGGHTTSGRKKQNSARPLRTRPTMANSNATDDDIFVNGSPTLARQKSLKSGRQERHSSPSVPPPRLLATATNSDADENGDDFKDENGSPTPSHRNGCQNHRKRRRNKKSTPPPPPPVRATAAITTAAITTAAIVDSSGASDEIKDLLGQISDLKAEKESLQQEIHGVKAALAEKDEALTAATDEPKDLLAQISDLKAEKESLQLEIHGVKAALAEKDEALIATQTDLAVLRAAAETDKANLRRALVAAQAALAGGQMMRTRRLYGKIPDQDTGAADHDAVASDFDAKGENEENDSPPPPPLQAGATQIKTPRRSRRRSSTDVAAGDTRADGKKPDQHAEASALDAEDNGIIIEKFALADELWDTLTKAEKNELRKAKATLTLLAAVLRHSNTYDYFSRLLKDEDDPKYNPDIVLINAKKIKVELGEALDKFLRVNKYLKDQRPPRKLTSKDIKEALTRRLKYVRTLENDKPKNLALLLGKKGVSHRQVRHQDNKEGLFGIVPLTDDVPYTEFYDITDIPKDKELTLQDLKISPLFDGAPDSLFALMKNDEMILQHVRDFGRVIFATQKNRKNYGNAALLDLVIAPAATTHHAPATVDVRNSLFFTMRSMYTGDTQMSKVGFFVTLYTELLHTQDKGVLMFLMDVIISVMSDEFKEGAEDKTLPEEEWNEIQKFANRATAQVKSRNDFIRAKVEEDIQG